VRPDWLVPYSTEHCGDSSLDGHIKTPREARPLAGVRGPELGSVWYGKGTVGACYMHSGRHSTKGVLG
jgi:hypothetical protein